jgi:uncharacterized protein (DUF1697 family)/menaquinone-dependent protoporphyrinogen IX oxidase
MKTAIIYTSKHGTTEKVACSIAEKIKKSHEVELFSLKKNPKPDISGFELVVLGSSIYAGQASGKIKAFCKANESVLLQKKTGLFVCGMEPDKEKQHKELKDAYPEALHNKAIATEFLGGAFLFEKMNLFERMIIKKIAKTTTSVERIGWEAVDEFIGKLINRMKTHIALLRGINVGGQNIIKMEALKQCFVSIGFSDVKTYIQSGNVMFKTPDIDKMKITETIENQLLKTFSIEIKTLILTADELVKIVENAPVNFGSEPEKFRYDVWFLLPSITADKIVSSVHLREGIDSSQAGENAIYTSRLASELGKSYLSKIIQTPLYKHITVRNWNTTTKLYNLIDK